MRKYTDRELRALLILEGVLMLLLLTIGIVCTGYRASQDQMLFFGGLIALVGARLALIHREQLSRHHHQRDESATALRESEERFHLMFEGHGAIMLLIEPTTGMIVDANLAAVQFYGYSKAQLCAMSINAINMLSPDQVAAERTKALHEERNYFIFPHKLASGIERLVEVYSSPIAICERQMLFSVIHDITERKHTEAALRQGEIRFRAMIEHAPGAITLVEADGRLKFVSASTQRVMGYHPDAMLGRNPAELTHPEDLPALLEILADLVQHPGKVCTTSYRFQHQDGSWRWVESAISNLLHEPSVSGIAFNFYDITERKQMEQELLKLNWTLEERVNQRTAEVQDLYENAPNGYHSLDANGNIIMINQTELTWLGYSREELIGRRFTDLITARSQILFHENYAGFMQRGWVRGLEYECIRKDGTTLHTLLDATAIYDAQGTFLMSRSTMVDNTVRKQAEDALRESEAQNRLLFAESPAPIALFDERGAMVQMNRAFELLTGYPSAQLTGRTLDALGMVPREHMITLMAAVAQGTRANNEFFTVEFGLKSASGAVREMRARLFRLTFQGRPHYLTAMHDITTEKQAEAILHRANAELERAARAKDEFLANMSHELRTPLNAILGLSEALQEQVYGPLSARQQASLRNIDVSGRHLLALINDILDLSKVEAGCLELQLDSVSVSDVCQASLVFVKELALKKAIQLTCVIDDPLAEMEADPRRMKQMLVNLLSNAVKFTLPQGQVRLDVRTDAAAGVIFFAVQDTGIGIAPDDLAQLFQPFRQIDSRLNRQHEGTGLGLALVRRLADLHGGSVTIVSEVGQGSRFTIALPYHPQHALETTHQTMTLPEPTAALDASPQPAPASAQILLAEDNEANMLAMSAYLQAKGYQVRSARTGQEAIDRASEERPDLILMDVQMPEIDGLEATRRLRGKAAYATTPIIALTALAMPGDRERCLAAGASDYMTKPVSLKELAATMERLLSSGGRDG